jgi:hypothetical protein
MPSSRNTTSLLLVLQAWGLLKYHVVGDPHYRGNALVLQTPHNTAVLVERATTIEWVVDMWRRGHLQPPDVMTVEEWVKQSLERFQAKHALGLDPEGGDRFASRKRVKSRIESPVSIPTKRTRLKQSNRRVLRQFECARVVPTPAEWILFLIFLEAPLPDRVREPAVWPLWR